jgi:hypothetical protein
MRSGAPAPRREGMRGGGGGGGSCHDASESDPKRAGRHDMHASRRTNHRGSDPRSAAEGRSRSLCARRLRTRRFGRTAQCDAIQSDEVGA